MLVICKHEDSILPPTFTARVLPCSPGNTRLDHMHSTAVSTTCLRARYKKNPDLQPTKVSS